MADTEPKINFPVLKNGTAVPATLANAPAAPVVGPKINLPTLQQVDPAQAQQLARQAVMKAHPYIQPVMEGLRSATFGLSDRALALLEPGKYDDNLKKIQADRDAYRADHPVASIAQGIAGGLATGGAVSNGLQTLGKTVLPTVASYAKTASPGGLATRIAQVLAENGIIGEAAHQGEQAPGQVGKDLGAGALPGAIMGAGGLAAGKVLGTAAKLGSGYGQKLTLAVGATSPEKFANSAFSKSLEDQNLSPDEIQSTLKFLRGDDIQPQGPIQPGDKSLPNSDLPIVVADALPKGTLGMIKRSMKNSDNAVTKVDGILKNRSEEQGTRLTDHLSNAVSPDINGSAQTDALMAARKAASDPLYQKAYDVGTVNDPAVDDWINKRPASAKLFKDVQQNLEDAGTPMTANLDVAPDGTFAWKTRPTVQDLDTMKKQLDARINKLWNPAKNSFDLPSDPKAQNAYQLMDQRNDLIDVINKATPDGQGGSYYDQARKAFADNTELMNANSAGKAIIRTRPEDVARTFDSFNGHPELQDQYRAGIASSLNDMLEKNTSEGNASILRRIYGTPGAQKKLNYVMGDPSTQQYFNRAMAGEKAMSDTQAQLAPRTVGSDPLAGESDFSIPLAALHALSGRAGSAINQLGRAGVGAIGGVAPEIGEHLADIAMMSPEQFAVWNAAQKAAQNSVSGKAKSIIGGLGQYIANGVPASLAGAAGREANNFMPNDQDYTDDSSN